MCHTGEPYCGREDCPRCEGWMPDWWEPMPDTRQDDPGGLAYCDEVGQPFDPKDSDDLPF